MNKTQFADKLKSWFHPSQLKDGGVMWGPNDDVLPWEPVIEQYEWYRRLGAWLKPKHFLEIGVGFGYSTLSILTGARDALYPNVLPPKVWWLDDESGWPGSVAHAQMLVRRDFGFTPVWFNDRDHFSEQSFMFDVVHIDAGHAYEDTLGDLTWSTSEWSEYPHVICHDTSDPPVSKAVDDFLDSVNTMTTLGFRTIEIPQVRCGVRVIHRCKGKCPVEEGLAAL